MPEVQFETTASYRNRVITMKFEKPVNRDFVENYLKENNYFGYDPIGYGRGSLTTVDNVIWTYTCSNNCD